MACVPQTIFGRDQRAYSERRGVVSVIPLMVSNAMPFNEVEVLSVNSETALASAIGGRKQS